MKEMEAEMKKLQDELLNKTNRIRHLEAKLGEASTVPEPVVQVVDNRAEVEAATAKMLDLEAQSRKKDEEIERLKKELADLKKSMATAGDGGNAEMQKLLDQALKVEEEL